MKPPSKPTMIPTGSPSCTPYASSVESFRFSRPFPPQHRPAFHDTVLNEILQERVAPRGHRRNQRGVKRKMSNFPLRRRTDKPLPHVNIEKAVRVLK